MNHAMTPQGEPMVVLTAAEYRALTDDARDAALADAAKEADAGAPVLNSTDARAVLAGALHPLAALRKSARLTQSDLAARAGVRVATLSDIEGGKIDPRLSTMKALAAALSVDIDDIVA